MDEFLLKLQEFFFEAASATYAGCAQKRTIGDLPRSKVYEYHRGEYLYIDTYFTNGEQSGGQTVIYTGESATIPAWIMQYHGWCKGDDKMVLDFLKTVLGRAYRSRAFCGGRGLAFQESEKDPLRYSNQWTGSFANFSGQEKIESETLKDEVLSDWNNVFWHRYQGMVLTRIRSKVNQGE
jgi:hypothetical protein